MRAVLGARNNAEWCDVICRAHGLPTMFDDAAWTSRTRTPPFYPDAVTLVPEPSVPELLARIDTSPGCSIKDSFASLDLAAYGFHALFEAQWIVRSGAVARPATSGPTWERMRDPSGLLAWESAWRGHDGPRGLFRPELLDNRDVAVLAARSNGTVVAGAILNRGTDVVGLSNFFAEPPLMSNSMAGCLALADRLFPGTTLVGYESGDQLGSVLACGFQTAGLLRVWLKSERV